MRTVFSEIIHHIRGKTSGHKTQIYVDSEGKLAWKTGESLKKIKGAKVIGVYTTDVPCSWVVSDLEHAGMSGQMQMQYQAVSHN